MFLKDNLKDIYQKASLKKNSIVLEKVINVWAHRFGVESLNELIVKNQNQINLIEDDQIEENQNQINLIEDDQIEENQNQVKLEILDNVKYLEEKNLKPQESEKFKNNEIINKVRNQSYKNKIEYTDIEELPLPNINNLRKWINNEKKAG